MAAERKARATDRIGPISGLVVVVVIVVGVIYYAGDWSPGSVVHPAERVFDLAIEDGKVAEDLRVIRVEQSDSVRLRWTADAPTVIHLHGYDIEKKVVPGAVAQIAFTARATGRFPVTVHGGDAPGQAHDETPLVRIEVHPR